ncbi:hypothetical protein ABT150_23245 [Streptomyces mirabilis]|uniref:hypothetical protein n=1 Tax=Streptomyces mirabilis TaxID=68239 RepID=UPI0033202EB8
MPEEPTPGPLGTESRRVTFPDGTVGIIAVQAGLSQDEADLIAAQVWAEIPEPGTPTA